MKESVCGRFTATVHSCKRSSTAVQKVEWNRGGTEHSGDYMILYMERGKGIMNKGQDFFYIRILYQQLKG
jgi:hypothetical protein